MVSRLDGYLIVSLTNLTLFFTESDINTTVHSCQQLVTKRLESIQDYLNDVKNINYKDHL